MKSKSTPPPALAGCCVEQYAVRDRSIRYSGHSSLYRNGKEVGPVPRLTICRDVDTGEVNLFHCGYRWNILGATSSASVIEARRCAERIYPGISAAWVRTGVTRTAAVRYLEKAGARRKCSFCGKLWHKVEYIMAKRRAGAEIAICGDCIRRLYRIIAEDSKEDPSSSAAEDR